MNYEGINYYKNLINELLANGYAHDSLTNGEINQKNSLIKVFLINFSEY